MYVAKPYTWCDSEMPPMVIALFSILTTQFIYTDNETKQIAMWKNSRQLISPSATPFAFIYI